MCTLCTCTHGRDKNESLRINDNERWVNNFGIVEK